MSEITKEALLKSIQDTMAEVNEILAKSEEMHKDESEDKPEQEGEMAPPAPEAEGEQAPPAPEAQPEAPEAQPEGQESGEQEGQELAAHAKDMSDSELHMLLEVLMSELESRKGGEGEQAPPAPEAEQAPQAPEMQEPAEKSAKEDMLKLTKSMSEIADAIGGLKKEIESLKAAPAPKKTVTTKPAPTNAQVLQKSAPAEVKTERLSKSETVDFLMGEMKKGNRSISSDTIWDVNAAKSPEELAQVQDRLVRQGVQFPKL